MPTDRADDPVIVEYELTWPIFRSIGTHQAIKRMRLAYGIIILLLLGLGIGLLTDWLQRETVLGVATAMTGVFVLLPAITISSARRQRQSGPLFREPKRLTVSASGIEVVGSASSSRVDWSGFLAVERAGRCVVFWLSARQGIFIPLEAFADEDHCDRFRAVVAGHIADCRL